ncbi:MAG: hypothetical protein HY927_03060 [Elusimicrobia bacterium]|nr:hypothetical protein [Elusimicrobiota bacterium]
MIPDDPATPPEPPAPPPPPRGRAVPPAPPPSELLKPPSTHIPLTPMMDFMERRLETMERELALERQRASSAENVLKSQDAMRAEVETQLKSLTEQIRREKAERASDEEKSQSKGRIDALESRLDQMHHTWADLLKETMLAREKTVQQWPADIVGEMKEWRQALAVLPRLLDAVGDLSERQSRQEAQVKEELRGLLGELAASIRDRFAQESRRHDLELAKQEEHLQAIGRERLALREAFDESGHALRAELLKERLAQEKAFGESLAAITARIDDVARRHEKADGDLSELKGLSARTLEKVSQPKAQDMVVAELESENEKLRKAFEERAESLRRYTEERRRIEATMGESLMDFSRQLSSEKDKSREAAASSAQKDLELATLRDKLAAAARAAEAADARCAGLGAERDELLRTLLAESERLRAELAARRASDESWAKKAAELQARLDEQTDLVFKEAAASRELRSQLATLSTHAAKALQEKDAAIQQNSSWPAERAQLLEAIKKKDDLLSVISSAFPNLLTK